MEIKYTTIEKGLDKDIIVLREKEDNENTIQEDLVTICKETYKRNLLFSSEKPSYFYKFTELNFDKEDAWNVSGSQFKDLPNDSMGSKTFVYDDYLLKKSIKLDVKERVRSAYLGTIYIGQQNIKQTQ